MSHTIRYRVPEEHYRETVDNETRETMIAKEGSIHHRAFREFTGLVTHSHDDGTHDIVIFPPAKGPVHVPHVAWGDGPGTMSVAGNIRRNPPAEGGEPKPAE